MNEPTQIRIGETTSWTETFNQYPSSAGWSLKYTINGNPGLAFVAVPDAAGNFDVNIPASGSGSLASFTPGNYLLSGFVEQGAGNSLVRHFISNTNITLLPNLSAPQTADQTPYWQSILDAAQAALKGIASKQQKAKTVNGITIDNRSPMELLQLVRSARYELARLARQQRIANGKPKRKILYQFRDVSAPDPTVVDPGFNGPQ